MLTFLKRLVGIDDEAEQAEKQFQRNLDALKDTNEKLGRANSQLDKIVKRVENKSEELRTMTKASGQHKLNLPPEAYRGSRESKPSF